MKRFAAAGALVLWLVAPGSARAASVTLERCYEQRATTQVPIAMLSTIVPSVFTVAPIDPLGLIGEYTVRAFQCVETGDDVELVLVTVPIDTPAGFQPGPNGSSVLLHAFSEHDAVTAALFKGCFGDVTQDAVITFGVVDLGPARAGVVFNDAGNEGVSLANSVALATGLPAGASVRLFARHGTGIRALDMDQGSSVALRGVGVDIFQDAEGPLGTATQHAIVEHRVGTWGLTLAPLSTC